MVGACQAASILEAGLEHGMHLSWSTAIISKLAVWWMMGSVLPEQRSSGNDQLGTFVSFAPWTFFLSSLSGVALKTATSCFKMSVSFQRRPSSGIRCHWVSGSAAEPKGLEACGNMSALGGGAAGRFQNQQ